MRGGNNLLWKIAQPDRDGGVPFIEDGIGEAFLIPAEALVRARIPVQHPPYEHLVAVPWVLRGLVNEL